MVLRRVYPIQGQEYDGPYHMLVLESELANIQDQLSNFREILARRERDIEQERELIRQLEAKEKDLNDFINKQFQNEPPEVQAQIQEQRQRRRLELRDARPEPEIVVAQVQPDERTEYNECLSCSG